MILELNKAVAREEGREIEDDDAMDASGMNGDAAPLVQSYGAGMNGSYGYGGGMDPYANGAGGSYMNGGGMPYR